MAKRVAECAAWEPEATLPGGMHGEIEMTFGAVPTTELKLTPVGAVPVVEI